jgi:hypothetical protein
MINSPEFQRILREDKEAIKEAYRRRKTRRSRLCESSSKESSKRRDGRKQKRGISY